VKKYRNILSLFILAAYTLFLFHDYIPHTHVHAFPVKQHADIHLHSADKKQTHQHSFPDQQEQKDDKTQLSELATDDHHQHHLMYRKSSQHKIFFPYTSHAAIPSHGLVLSAFNYSKEIYTVQYIAYKSPQLYATPQLRAPPMSI
jgi:hypothetical protein